MKKLVLLVCLFVLVGCGSNSNGDTKTSGESYSSSYLDSVSGRTVDDLTADQLQEREDRCVDSGGEFKDKTCDCEQAEMLLDRMSDKCIAF